MPFLPIHTLDSTVRSTRKPKGQTPAQQLLLCRTCLQPAQKELEVQPRSRRLCSQGAEDIDSELRAHPQALSHAGLSGHLSQPGTAMCLIDVGLKGHRRWAMSPQRGGPYDAGTPGAGLRAALKARGPRGSPGPFLPPQAQPCRSEGLRLSSRAASRGGKVTGRHVVRPLISTMGP